MHILRTCKDFLQVGRVSRQDKTLIFLDRGQADLFQNNEGLLGEKVGNVINVVTKIKSKSSTKKVKKKFRLGWKFSPLPIL